MAKSLGPLQIVSGPKHGWFFDWYWFVGWWWYLHPSVCVGHCGKVVFGRRHFCKECSKDENWPETFDRMNAVSKAYLEVWYKYHLPVDDDAGT